MQTLLQVFRVRIRLVIRILLIGKRLFQLSDLRFQLRRAIFLEQLFLFARLLVRFSSFLLLCLCIRFALLQRLFLIRRFRRLVFFFSYHFLFILHANPSYSSFL